MSIDVRLIDWSLPAYEYPLLIKQLLHAPLSVGRPHEIVYRDRYRYDYKVFGQRLGKLANALRAIGVEPGDTVAVLDWDSHRYLECYFAVPMMGAVLQTVNVRLAPKQIFCLLEDARATVLLVHKEFLGVLKGFLGQLHCVRKVVLIADGTEIPLSNMPLCGEYEQLVEAAGTEYEFPELDERAPATIFHTSGTTGHPKAVSFSHRQIVLHTLAVLGGLARSPGGPVFRDDDVYMPMTPMFHVHAWGLPYVATLLGVKQVYPGRYVAHELLALREREGVTYSHCVPAILQMLLSTGRELGSSLRGWKLMIGGSALSEKLAREALSAGIEVFAGYGMSETAPILAIARLSRPAGMQSEAVEVAQRCSAGVPMPLVDLRVVSQDMEQQPADGQSVGEIVLRAPWATACYIGKPKETEELWRGGYLHTQDIGALDEEGCLRITDRIKDVIKTGGEWLSSIELEKIIAEHEGVAEVAVIGVPDQRWGERPLVLVVPRSHSALRAEDIREHVAKYVTAGELPNYAAVHRVTLVPSLEKTSVGKIDKRALRARYGDPPAGK